MRIQLPPHYLLLSGLGIPAGQKDFAIGNPYILPQAIDAVGVGAHTHYLATRLKMNATLPGGEIKTLLLIKDRDFAWQYRYYFKDYVARPKWTKLKAEIHWDNSAENPHNPLDPSTHVSRGDESKDEMGSLSLIVVPHLESDLAVLQNNIATRARQLARERMQADHVLARKVMRIRSEQKSGSIR